MLGDFNSKPSNSAFQLISGRGLEYNIKEDLDTDVLKTVGSKKSLNKRDKFIKDVQKDLKYFKFEVFTSAYQFYNESLRS